MRLKMFAPTPFAAASTRSIVSFTEYLLGFVTIPAFLSKSPLSSPNADAPSNSKAAAMLAAYPKQLSTTYKINFSIVLPACDSKVKTRFLAIAAGVVAYPTIGPQSIAEATSRALLR
jgi:hypothetical protein